MAVKISATFTAAFADVSINKRLFSSANILPSCATKITFHGSIITFLDSGGWWRSLLKTWNGWRRSTVFSGQLSLPSVRGQ